VAAGDEKRDEREVGAAGRKQRGKQVAFQVMHADCGDTERKCEAMGERSAH
jgi:hypothetical protein